MTRNLEENVKRVAKELDAALEWREKQIRDAYKAALKDIQKTLALMYQKYAREGKLTYAEMTKYNRLTGLEAEIGKILGMTDRDVKRTINKLTAEQYEKAYFGHAWAIEQNIGVALKWGLVRAGDIEAVIDNPLALIAKDSLTQVERTRLRRVLTQGLIKGESYPKMARGISEVINRSYADAIRIARTEGGRAQTEGTIQSFKAAEEAGVEARWIWVATKDERTRDSHREMDGEAAEVRDGEHEWYLAGEWVRGPRLHSDAAETCNCRCTTRMEIEGLAPKLMRSKEYGVEPYMPYAEWERKHKK